MGRMIAYQTPAAARFLDRICPIPNPIVSYEAWERAHHRDLATATDADLRRERRRTIYRLDLENDQHPWLIGRLAAVEAELRRRQPPPPRPAPWGRR